MKRVISRNILDAESESCEKLPHLEYIEKELAKIFPSILPVWSAKALA